MSEAPSVKALLGNANTLKRRSRSLRDDGNLDGALRAIEEAIKLVEPALNRRVQMLDTAGESSLVLTEARDLAAQLADLHGSRGGILRRANKYAEALGEYRKGRSIETNEVFRVENTYNQLQWITLQLLQKPELLENHDIDLTGAIDRVSCTLEQQVLTIRRDDPWAHSDLGLVKMLNGDSEGANAAWDKMDDLDPIPSVYSSGLSLLRDLAAKLPQVQPLQAAVQRFASHTPGSGAAPIGA